MFVMWILLFHETTSQAQFLSIICMERGWGRLIKEEMDPK